MLEDITVKRRGEESEERGRYRESEGSYEFAMISYLNARQLYEEIKDSGKLRVIKNCIKRVENILNHQDEINTKN